MANYDYSTQPSNIMPGLQMFGQGLQRRAGVERERVEKQKTENLRKKATSIFQSGNTEAIAKFVGENPEAKEIYKDMIGAENESMLNISKKYLIEKQDPFNLHIEAADQDILEGKDPAGNIEMARAMAGEKTRTEATKQHESVLAMLDPKAYKSYMAQQGRGITEKGKKLKLDQLITKRNSFPEDSEDRKLYEQAIAKEVALPGEKKSRPYISKLMADGWLPSGRITGPMLDAFEAAAAKAEEMGTPLTIDKLRKMDFEATKNRKTGSTAGSRLVLARKQNIEAAQGLLKDLQKTSKKLNYTPVKFIASLEKFKNKQTVSPIFTEYMTQRADSLFVLGNALKQNGLTDKSIEVEEEAFSPTLSPQAFNAWYNTQVRALNRAAGEMNRDYGFGISLMPAFEAGQAGAPTDEQPIPVMPPEGGHGQPATQSKYQEGQTATINGKPLIFTGGQWRDN